jgi:hypothetical protein
MKHINEFKFAVPQPAEKENECTVRPTVLTKWIFSEIFSEIFSPPEGSWRPASLLGIDRRVEGELALHDKDVRSASSASHSPDSSGRAVALLMST